MTDGRGRSPLGSTSHRAGFRQEEPAARTYAALELRDYLDILSRRRWVVLLVTFVVVAVVLVGTLVGGPSYTASTTIRTAAGGSLLDRTVRADDLEYLDRIQNTYAKLLTSNPIVDDVMREVDLAERPGIKVVLLPNTELMQIRIQAARSEDAVRTANALANALVAYVRRANKASVRAADRLFKRRVAQLEAEIARLRADLEPARGSSTIRGAEAPELRLSTLRHAIAVREASLVGQQTEYEAARLARLERANALTIVSRATARGAASSSSLFRNAVLALVVGLVAGAGLAFLFENLTRRLTSVEDIKETSAAPVVGLIPREEAAGEKARFNSGSPAEDAFHRLRMTVLALQETDRLSGVLVTSAESGEGKSTIVANLAYSLAEAGRSVVVVDAHFRSPAQHALFGVANELGLVDVLDEGVSLEDATQATAHPGLYVLPSGSHVPRPGLLVSVRLTEVLTQLAARYTFVLIDSPALLAVSDALALAQSVEAVLLVVRAGRAERDDVRAAREQLAAIHARVIGVVVNGVEPEARRQYEWRHLGATT